MSRAVHGSVKMARLRSADQLSAARAHPEVGRGARGKVMPVAKHVLPAVVARFQFWHVLLQAFENLAPPTAVRLQAF